MKRRALLAAAKLPPLTEALSGLLGRLAFAPAAYTLRQTSQNAGYPTFRSGIQTNHGRSHNARHFHASELDRYGTTVVEMLARATAGPTTRTAPPTHIVNLMDALRRSIAAEKPTRAAAKSAERKKPVKEP